MRLVYITIAWIAGLTLANRFPVLEPMMWGMAVTLSAILIAVGFRNHRLRWIGIMLTALMLGGLRQSLVPKTSDIARYNGGTGTIEGIVIDEPDIRDDRIQLRVEAGSIFTNSDTYGTQGQVLVEAVRLTNVKYGDRIRATGALITPAEWDTFSYADYLGRQGVFTVMPYAGVEVLESGYGSPFFGSLIDLKLTVQRQISLALPEPQAGLLTGILLGNERGISPELADDFSRVGASHIIAISGFNMVIVSAIVMRFFESIFRDRKAPAILAGVIVITVYTVFVGANLAVVRAAMMSSLLVIAQAFDRKTYVPASLAFVTLLLSIAIPSVIQDIGFQLSFLAVFGLSTFADPMSQWFRSLLERGLPSSTANLVHTFLNEPLIVSLAAQIATLPLIVLYFGRFSIVSLVVNVLIVPVQTILLVVGMVAVGVTFLSPAIGGILYWIDMFFLSWSIEVVRRFAQLPFADVALNIDSRLIQALYVFLFGGAIMSAIRPPWWIRLVNFITQRTMFVLVSIVGVVIPILMVGMVVSRPDGQLHVWMLDVGHTNAILLQTPNGAHMLIDGGRFPSRLLTALGDRLPYHDREIEILAVTHPDEFDISALNAILERYTVGVALLNGQPNRTETYLELQDRLSTTNTVTVQAGYQITLDDGVIIDVLHPQADPSIIDPLGDHVMVLRVSYGDVSILLTSDISRVGQGEILRQGISPTSSVMQLPNHGTIQSLDDEFLELVQPQVVLVQSDQANRRGDPDADVLAMLGDISIFRTDELGTIHLLSDGQSIWVVGDQ